MRRQPVAASADLCLRCSGVTTSDKEKTTASTPAISLSPFSHLEGKLLWSCFLNQRRVLAVAAESEIFQCPSSLTGFASLLFSSAIQSGQRAINAGLKLGGHLISCRVGRKLRLRPLLLLAAVPVEGELLSGQRPSGAIGTFRELTTQVVMY